MIIKWPYFNLIALGLIFLISIGAIELDEKKINFKNEPDLEESKANLKAN